MSDIDQDLTIFTALQAEPYSSSMEVSNFGPLLSFDPSVRALISDFLPNIKVHNAIDGARSKLG